MSQNRANFFRQSAWLAFATVVGGAFMTAVHTVASKMETGQWEIFGTMLRAIFLLGIPSAGLQIAFARQAATALTPEAKRQLASTMRQVLGAIVGLWLVMALVMVLGQDALVSQFKLGNSRVLWPTLVVALLWLMVPVFRGALQGAEEFGFLGWSGILDGLVRFSGVCVLVGLIHGGAASAVVAAMLGLMVSSGLAAWASRSLWRGPGAPFRWRPWLAEVLPFTVGASAMIVLANFDLVYLKAVIPADLADQFQMGERYQPASLIGFALTQVTVPLAMVMFPKIARSSVGGGRTDALALAFTGTAILGVLAVGFVIFFPKFPLQILFFRTPQKWVAAPLVPWCSAAMLAYSLANVLVSNLLAQRRFSIVPWAAGVAVTFLGTMGWLRPQLIGLEPFAAFRLVAQVIGGFNLLLLGIAATLTWGGQSPAQGTTPPAASKSN